MHSFDDEHDFHGFQYPQFSFNQGIDANNTTPLQSDYLPALRTLHELDKLDQSSDPQDDWNSYLAKHRPLLLPLDDPMNEFSEFQSNGIGPSHSLRSLNSREKTGLGLQICYERKESWSIDESTGANISSTSSGCIARELQISASSCEAVIPSSYRFEGGMKRAFHNRMASAGKPFNELNEQGRLSTLPIYSADSDDYYFSTGLSRLLSSLTDSDSSSLSTIDSSSSLPGLVADINMFKRVDTGGGICVRPQDLVMNEDEERAPEVLKSESQEKLPVPAAGEYCPLALPGKERRYSPDLGKPTQMPDPRPLHEQFTLNNSLQLINQAEIMPLHVLGPSSAVTFSITSRIPRYSYTPDVGTLQTGKDSEGNSEKMRVPLSERANLTGNISRAKSSVNVLDLHDDSIPFDVALRNPHEGISAEIVAQKTRYFIMTHPGERLSDELLFNFAGRLSVRGEPVQGYRCYVSGCEKTTKRKDHMGDHIRTHLGEKPFQCSICGLGFIRNNDCQRHENNHRPDKRFVCDCQAAFSRRDLFVRHQKTACLLKSGSNSVGPRRPRKYVKAFGREVSPGDDDINDLDYNPRENLANLYNSYS